MELLTKFTKHSPLNLLNGVIIIKLIMFMHRNKPSIQNILLTGSEVTKLYVVDVLMQGFMSL